MRPWLVLKLAGINFDETIIPLKTDKSVGQIASVSPSGRVPALHHNENVIWDSLSICEYINEIKPDANLWPSDSQLRSVARSVCSTMHSSFAALRVECHMNMQLSCTKELSISAQKDINDIYSLWSLCKAKSGSNKYLFGDFTIADAFFAPVVSRILSYGIKRSNEQDDYINLVKNNQYYQEWYKAAMLETWTI